MKKVFKLFTILLTLSVLMSACSGGNKRNSKFIKPVKIEIPDEIKGDEELVDLVESSEKAINEFSDNIEQLAIDSKDILKKAEEDNTFMDGVKAAQLMLEFVSNSNEMTATLEKFVDYVESRQSNDVITDEQLKALEQVAKAFNDRIDLINEKYKDYYEK